MSTPNVFYFKKMQSAKLLQRIREYAQSRRVDLEDELVSYDYKRIGSISTISFPRCFANIGLQLSPSQYQILIDDFSQNGYICIKDFVQAVKDSEQLSRATEQPQHFCEDELRQLDCELTKRRQNLYDAVRKYDRLNNGKVPTECFYTEFGFGPAVRKIVNEYQEDGYINYHELQKDLTMSNDKVQLPDSFKQLSKIINEKKIDLFMILNRFDTERTGQLQARPFISFLSSLGVSYGPSEIEKLIHAFRLPNGLYDANKFIQLVQENKEEDPLAKLKISRDFLKTIDPLDVLNHAKDYFRTHRFNLNEIFQRFDQEGCNGVIPQALFLHVFHMNNFDFSRYEAIQLASLFPGEEPETVNYHNFIDTVVEKPPPEKTNQTVDDVLDRIKDYLKQQRRHLRPVADRFDREHSGDITPSQLISAFQFLKFRLTNVEVVLLRNAFPGHRQGSVDYIALSNEIDPIEESYLQLRVSQKAQFIETQAETPSTRLIPPNIAASNRKVLQACTNANIKINPLLVKLDKNLEGLVPQSLFVNLLSSPPISLPPGDVKVIVSFYRLNGASEIDYVKFCSDLALLEITPEQPPQPTQDEIQQQIQEETNGLQHARPLQRIPPSFPMIVRLFLKRYRLFILSSNLPMDAPFAPIDGGRTGLVPINRVQECFTRVGFETSRDELESTINTFRDFRRERAFNYDLFIRSSEAEVTDYANIDVPPEVQKEVNDIEMAIKEKLSSRNRSIRMAFAGIARPTISIETFLERLATVDVMLRTNQSNALVRKYRMDQSDQIDWRRFCTDVDNCRTLGF